MTKIKDEELSGLGPVIRSIRKSKKMKQGVLVKKIKISQTYLSQIEKNHKHPAIKTLKKIAKALEVPVPVIVMLSLSEKDIPENKKLAWKTIGPVALKLIKSVFLA